MNALRPIKSTQEAYDRIKRYFSKPGARIAISDVSGGCMYKTGDGAKCAVGCLIPDALYSTVFEETNVQGLLDGEWDQGWLSEDPKTGEPIKVDEEALLEGLQDYFSNVDRDFLSQAQTLHDTSKSAEGFVAALERKAERLGLTP